VRTLLATGIRVSGLVDMDRGDIDVQQGRLLIHAKGGHRQAVGLDTELAMELDGPESSDRC
jgi:site-specific recombinase XerD